MPVLGEIRRAGEIGKRSSAGLAKHILAACEDCGKERWVQLIGGMPKNKLCCSCANRRSGIGRFGECNRGWKGGIHYSNGYVYIYKPEHPRADCNGYAKRAILVLEEKLGRPLLEGMDSHHKNEIRDDDRPRNLEEKTRGEHTGLHTMRRLINRDKAQPPIFATS